jgi:hypothetical protein
VPTKTLASAGTLASADSWGLGATATAAIAIAAGSAATATAGNAIAATAVTGEIERQYDQDNVHLLDGIVT